MSADTILILGHGAMGRMFENLLRPHYAVSVWDRDPETGIETEQLETVVSGHALIILALPTGPHAELAGRIANAVTAPVLCLSIAKGLDANGQSPAEILADNFDENEHTDWAVIYGSMIARDLAEGRDGFALAAASKLETARSAVRWFAPTKLYLEASDDPVGAAWSAILKNVYVPLIGMAEGLELGDNMRGFLICEALRELAQIVASRGGKPETAYKLCGLGDLVTTATSASSHHRQIGEDLAEGDYSSLQATGANIRSEGVNTASMVLQHKLFDTRDYPLFDLTARLLETPDNAEEAIRQYLTERFQ